MLASKDNVGVASLSSIVDKHAQAHVENKSQVSPHVLYKHMLNANIKQNFWVTVKDQSFPETLKFDQSRA